MSSATPPLIGWFDRAIERASSVLAVLSGIVLCALTALVLVMVVLRYVFGTGLFGVEDVLRMGMAAAVICGMPYCARSDGHVSIDLFHHMMSPAWARTSLFVAQLLSAGVFVLLAVRAWESAASAFRWSEATDLLRLPHGPVWVVICGAGLLTALVFAWAAYRVLSRNPEAGYHGTSGDRSSDETPR